jgi:imidazolonepropionase-like amidohydrolase
MKRPHGGPASWISICGSLAALCLFEPNALGQVAARRPVRLALVGGTIHPAPGVAPIRDGVVVIEGDRIVGVGSRSAVPVPAGATVLDCGGGSVLAGFWNSHVHFSQRKWQAAASIPADELTQQLQEMLTGYGFTTVFDTGSALANTKQIGRRVAKGEVLGPDILTAGEIIWPPGGAPRAEMLQVLGFMASDMPEAGTAQKAATLARRLLDAGADGVKLYAATWATDPSVVMPAEAIAAAAREAHRRGKPALAHPSNRPGIEAALAGGVDILVHSAPQSGEWDAALLAEMKKHRMALIPTLKLWRYETRHARLSGSRRFLQAAVDQLRRFARGGGEVLFGTDVGYMADYDPTDEYVLMEQAGLSFQQVLASLTTAPAARFGARDKGRIERGKRADLVVLASDPTADLRVLARVRTTIRAGRVIYSGINTIVPAR